MEGLRNSVAVSSSDLGRSITRVFLLLVFLSVENIRQLLDIGRCQGEFC